MYSRLFSPAKAWALSAFIACAGAASVQASDPKPVALITFGGVYNGDYPWNDPNVVHRPMPSGYQPLMESSPRTMPVDGGNLHTRITWDGACVSNHAYNSRVTDHTGDPAGGVLFGTSPFSMTFSRPVIIHSLFWTYYISTLKTGVISIYRHPDDSLPLKSVTLRYPDATGYHWRELLEFGGLGIQKITFDPGDETHTTGLNIDDMTVEEAK